MISGLSGECDLLLMDIGSGGRAILPCSYKERPFEIRGFYENTCLYATIKSDISSYLLYPLRFLSLLLETWNPTEKMEAWKMTRSKATAIETLSTYSMCQMTKDMDQIKI